MIMFDFFDIIIGAAFGIILGFIQMMVLKRVVLILTSESGGGAIYVVLLFLQFLGFVGALVLIGIHSIVSALIAGIVMIITATIVWMFYHKKN